MNNDNPNEIDFLYEWAVWGHLISKKDIEAILLKGHLMLEMILKVILSRNGISNDDDISFYRKLTLLEKNVVIRNDNDVLIINALKGINLMRNKLAHEVLYDDLDTDIENWSKVILNNLKGMKYSKYTYKTKIVHSFSILATNLLKVKVDVRIKEPQN